MPTHKGGYKIKLIRTNNRSKMFDRCSPSIKPQKWIDNYERQQGKESSSNSKENKEKHHFYSFLYKCGLKFYPYCRLKPTAIIKNPHATYDVAYEPQYPFFVKDRIQVRHSVYDYNLPLSTSDFVSIFNCYILNISQICAKATRISGQKAASTVFKNIRQFTEVGAKKIANADGGYCTDCEIDYRFSEEYKYAHVIMMYKFDFPIRNIQSPARYVITVLMFKSKELFQDQLFNRLAKSMFIDNHRLIFNSTLNPIKGKNTCEYDRIYRARNCFTCCKHEKRRKQFKRCKLCKIAYYCSKKCQKRDWNELSHKRDCVKWNRFGFPTLPMRKQFVCNKCQKKKRNMKTKYNRKKKQCQCDCK